jgi:hypothetical protein
MLFSEEEVIEIVKHTLKEITGHGVYFTPEKTPPIEGNEMLNRLQYLFSTFDPPKTDSGKKQRAIIKGVLSGLGLLAMRSGHEAMTVISKLMGKLFDPSTPDAHNRPMDLMKQQAKLKNTKKRISSKEK